LDAEKKGAKLIVPGFIDSHIHVMMGGFGLTCNKKQTNMNE